MEFWLTHRLHHLQDTLLHNSIHNGRYAQWTHFAILLWDFYTLYRFWVIVSELVSNDSDKSSSIHIGNIRYGLAICSRGIAARVLLN